jgi:hypothetical protein
MGALLQASELTQCVQHLPASRGRLWTSLAWLVFTGRLLFGVGQRGPGSLLLLGLSALLLAWPIRRAWARRDLSDLMVG